MSATLEAVASRAVIACATQCGLCSDLCMDENRPHCAKICRDCAEICWTAAAFISRHGHGLADVTGAAAKLCEACATECEQHDVEHCRQTAVACREAIAALRQQTETTPRTPSGERL